MIRSQTVVLMAVCTILGSCTMGLKHSKSIDGTPFSYVSEGSGGPTVVFESGIGDGLDTWEPIFEDVAVFTAAFAYSRAGYSGSSLWGGSDPQRTADEVARTTKELLNRTETEGPYLLVGHSMGGMYVLRFAELYPGDVAGVVLVDGRPKEFDAECKAAGLSPCGPPDSIALASPPHVAAEIRGIEESEKQMPEPSQLGAFPITVIVATEPPPGAPSGGQEIWLRVQRDFAESVANGRFVVAEGSGHYIHRDQPELVLDEIRSMVDSLRQASTNR